jgi:hypothetical protein
MILAFLAVVIGIPGVTWEVIPAGWPFMSIAIPALLAFDWVRKGTLGTVIPTPLTLLGVGLIVYAFLSLRWALAPELAWFEVWQLLCLAAAFVYGSTQPDLRKVAIGLAIGLSISSLIAISQYYSYYHFHPEFQLVGEWRPERPSGLLWNPVVLGEAIALTIVLLVTYREWLYIPALLPGLYLCQSRGAWLALGVVAMARLNRWTLLGLVPLAAAFWFLPTASDQQRLDIWRLTYEHLTWLGHGAGALYSTVYVVHNIPYKPAFAHNEFLDFIYLYGVGGLTGCALLLAPLTVLVAERWAYLTFFLLALFSFPLHDPVLVFISGAIAGCVGRSWTNPIGALYGPVASFRTALPQR